MLREKLLTIVIGLIVGALLAAIYFFGPGLVKNIQNPTSPSTTPTPTTATKETTEVKAKKISLTINSPEDNSSTKTAEVKIAGVATPNAKLVLFANADEKSLTAGGDGKFESTVKLEEGENEVTITDLTEPIETKTINVTLEISD